MHTNRRHRSWAALRFAIAASVLTGGLMLELAGCDATPGMGESVVQGYGSAGRAPVGRGSGKIRTRTPSVSPYLNLLRNNNGATPPGINYFTQVRPQFQQQRVNARQQSELYRLEDQAARMGQMQTAPMPITGRGATYRNYSHFYPSLGSVK